MCLSVEEVLNKTSCDNWEKNYHMRFYWVLQLPDKLSHEVLLSTSSTERPIITWGSIEYFNFQTNYHMRFYWVLPQLREKLSHEVLLSIPQLRDKLSHHEVLLSTSSTERKIITWGSIEYFLNWEKNYHMRFYWVLPQLREKLSHEVLLSISSTETNYHIMSDNFSLSWGSTQ
jgi:hypothetical protein